MALTRVWNITDDPSTDVPVQNLMVLGKLLKPGQSMQVDEKDLAKAHKITKDVGAKLLAVGKAAPSYRAGVKRATLPASMTRSHGEVTAEVAAEAPAKVEAKLAEEKPAASEEAKDEAGEESRKFGKHNRGR